MPMIIGFCSLFQAFTVDIRETLAQLKGPVGDSNKPPTAHEWLEIHEKLIKTVAFHSEAMK